jgi:ABC-2 type transport system ATP-binding protein
MTAPAIATRGLTKAYGDVHALNGIDLEVPAGTVFGLLGPNGAGKTTAVRILCTVTTPTSGEASVAGLDVVSNAQEVREHIGLAGQYAAVDERLTGHENLFLVGRLTHLSRKRSHERADELLERFDLVDAAHRPVRTYSGGMRRRLDLAAALVHEPPVLFLDEHTTGLDPRSRQSLWEITENLVAGGTTVLLTTQYLEEADRLADHIALIDDGRVIAEGSGGELKAQYGATVIEAAYDDDRPVSAALAALAPLGEVEAVGSAVILHVVDGARELAEVVRRLDAAGAPPDAMAVREPTLDDVFLQLTGKPAEPHDDDAGDGVGSSGAAPSNARVEEGVT